MNWKIKAAVAVVIYGAGMLTGWIFWKPTPTKPETYAREVRQQDGSMVLERKPQADAKPAQQIPAGAKVERVVQVTVQPRAVAPSSASEAPAETNGIAQEAKASPAGATSIPWTPCPPVLVDLSLVRMKDQSRRVIASSPDGEVVGGVDIPVETPDRPRELRWSAGGIYGVTSGGGRSVGAFLHRDVAFLRLGAEVTRDTAPNVRSGWNGRVLAGIRF